MAKKSVVERNKKRMRLVKKYAARRAKLKAIRPDHDPIVTHRGIGYSLKDET